MTTIVPSFLELSVFTKDDVFPRNSCLAKHLFSLDTKSKDCPSIDRLTIHGGGKQTNDISRFTDLGIPCGIIHVLSNDKAPSSYRSAHKKEAGTIHDTLFDELFASVMHKGRHPARRTTKKRRPSS